MILTLFFFVLSLYDFVAGQIPNPIRYRLTVNDDNSRRHYAIDKKFYKLSRKVYSLEDDPSSVSNTQDIYVPSEGRTYSFQLKSSPPCIVNRGAPSSDLIDYWASIVKSYGGENRTFDEIVIDADCSGACLTWLLNYNSTAVGYTINNRLYIRQNDSTPIKLISTLHDLYTGKFISTTVIKYSDWNLRRIPDSEFEFPIDSKLCYFA